MKLDVLDKTQIYISIEPYLQSFHHRIISIIKLTQSNLLIPLRRLAWYFGVLFKIK